jgi:hypothetical protein
VKKINPTIILALANALIWGIPTAIFLLLNYYQFEDGHWSPFLLIIGPVPYGAGFFLSTVGIIGLIKSGQLQLAHTAAITFMILGLPLSVFGVLMLGST